MAITGRAAAPGASIGARYWERRLARWPRPRRPPVPGYSLLLPVPGDLPELLELALTACAEQDAAHRVETLVVPDRATAEVAEVVERRARTWVGPLRLQRLPPPERWWLHRLRSGSRNHGMQLYAGVAAARATHIVLHDADLFPLTPDLHETQWLRCSEGRLACVGVSPVWDGWYGEHGRVLAATWEMVAEVGWLRAWPPVRHIGHDNDLWGERHTFDTTLYPQACTEPGRIAVADREADLVHFNYVITTYRAFQAHGAGFVDDRFRILCTAVLRELLGTPRAASDVPGTAELAAGLATASPVVAFPPPPAGTDGYRELRDKLGRLLTATWVQPARAAGVRTALAPFDHRYGVDG